MKKIFVFGSNEAGIHGAGAAHVAMKAHGAEYGIGVGRTGNCYAIPTKDRRIRTLRLGVIREYVEQFKAHAHVHGKDTFQVTRIGCGLAGFKDKDIAPMFIGCPRNCEFDEAWRPYLGEGYKYWGTY